MNMFRHPIALVLIVVTIIVIIGCICESREDCERQRTKQLELQVKLEQLKQGNTNAAEMIINKK